MCSASRRGLRNRLPSRVLVAWAVLGATVGESLMYSNRVYYGEGRDCFLWYPWNEDEFNLVVGRWGESCWSTGTVRILGFTVYDEEAPRGEALRIVARWHLGVAVAVGLIGATVGTAIHRVRRRRPAEVGDSRLWMPLSTLVFALLIGFGVPGEGLSIGRVTSDRIALYRHLPTQWVVADLIGLVRELIRLGLLALPVGWAAHRVALSVGVRLPRRGLPDQAADYDDRTAVPTP